MSQARTPNFVEGLSAQNNITGQQKYLTSTTSSNIEALDVNVISGGGAGTQYQEGATTAPGTGTLAIGRYDATPPTLSDGQLWGLQLTEDGSLKVSDSGTPPISQNVNLIEVGGASIALGQTTMSASLPVVIANNQSTLTISGTVTANAGTDLNTSALLTTSDFNAAFGTAGTPDSQVMSIQGITSMTPVSVTGTVDPTTPSTLVAFVTTVTTAGTRVQLGSNAVIAGIVQAPSTNTGIVYVGGSNVSSTVFGAELQPGQASGIQIDNTNKLWVDSASNGDRVAFFGS